MTRRNNSLSPVSPLSGASTSSWKRRMIAAARRFSFWISSGFEVSSIKSLMHWLWKWTAVWAFSSGKEGSMKMFLFSETVMRCLAEAARIAFISGLHVLARCGTTSSKCFSGSHRSKDRASRSMKYLRRTARSKASSGSGASARGGRRASPCAILKLNSIGTERGSESLV